MCVDGDTNTVRLHLVTTGTMLNLNVDGNANVTCEQTFRYHVSYHGEKDMSSFRLVYIVFRNILTVIMTITSPSSEVLNEITMSK